MKKVALLIITLIFIALIIFELSGKLHNSKILEATVIRVNYYRSITLTVELKSGRTFDVSAPKIDVGRKIKLSCFNGLITKKLYCDYIFQKIDDSNSK
ncbi:MAG: hypothetical protein HWE16_02600 [Gammaproteobacteria bacterium]|nr:hypothetical protein [Gammaproteobacteria bacterium]